MNIFLPKSYYKAFLLLVSIGFVLNVSAQTIQSKGQKNHNVDAGCTPDSAIFNYNSSTQSFTVPACVTSITVRAWGGGGGGAGNDSHVGMAGGGGAFATSTLTVTPGQVISVIVGGGGGLGQDGAASTGAGAGGFGLGDGGSGGDPGSSGTSGAGGGGGGGTGLVSGGVILIDAAGGGGGGGGGNYTVGGAGGASGQAGTPGASGNEPPLCFCTYTGGAGGTPGGSADTVGTQGANRGVGNDGGAGGGGGGGDNAGTGGGAPNCDCGGGGGAGGSSLATTIINGSGQTVGNSTYATLPAGTGAGGAQGVNGGNGYLVISYCVPVIFTISSTQKNASCGGNDGYAVVQVTSGTGPFTYSWSTTPVQTTDTAKGLSPGNYTVTVSNGGACTQTATYTITGQAPLRDSITSFNNISTTCGTNGSATVGVKGGDGVYAYSWNTTPVQTNATASNLGPGNYTVTVTDNTCNATATVTITQPGGLKPSIADSTPVSCNGGNNGTATAAITGGSAPYTYSWSNGLTGIKDSMLVAGNYTVSITDANNCTVKAIAIITQPGAIRDSISKTINILCNGQTNGQATDGLKGGTGAFIYSWNTAPVQTTQTATGLGVGSYTVVATDANGCKDSTIATITQPTVVELTASPFAATCNGVCNGSATVIPKGGTSPYKYLWSNTTSATSANVTGLCAGSYSVVVMDANGCTHDTTNLVVTQPPAIVLTKTETAAFCGKADGSATASVSGGTPPYLYAWSNGQTSTNLTNVTPGSYCFGVQDANKCQDSICVIIGNIPGETASITSVTPVTCNGGTNGTATGTATGGTQPYTYSWTTAPAQTNATATNLSAAAYTLTVTDSAGCTSKAIATVIQPALVVTTLSASPATICYGGTPSTLTASSTGGNGQYVYSWAPTANLNDSTGPSVAASPTATTIYTVTSSDTNKCPAAQVTVTVTVDPKLSVTTGTPVAACPGKSVTLSAKASGGNGNYTYTWQPGNETGANPTVSPSSTGYYTVIVSDGCTNPDAKDSMEAIIDPLPVIAFTADTLNGCYPACVLFTDKSTISSGGIKSWTWAFGDGNTYGSNTTASKVDTGYNCYANPGAYSVTETVVSDSGCPNSYTNTNMITVYDHPHTNFTASPQSTTIEQPGIVFTDQTTDAYGITNWLWETFGDASDSIKTTKNTTHTYSDTGTFCVKLVDINKHNCVDSVTICVVVNALYTLYIPNAFTPNSDGKNDVFAPQGTYFTSFEMYVFDRWGTPIYHTTDMNKGWNGSVNNTGPLSQQDTYVYVITVYDFRGTEHSYLGKVTLVK